MLQVTHVLFHDFAIRVHVMVAGAYQVQVAKGHQHLLVDVEVLGNLLELRLALRVPVADDVVCFDDIVVEPRQR